MKIGVNLINFGPGANPQALKQFRRLQRPLMKILVGDRLAGDLHENLAGVPLGSLI